MHDRPDRGPVMLNLDPADLAAQQAKGFNTASFVAGRTGDNVLAGTIADDLGTGLAGTEKITGRNGKDEINGGFGNDILHGLALLRRFGDRHGPASGAGLTPPRSVR